MDIKIFGLFSQEKISMSSTLVAQSPHKNIPLLKKVGQFEQLTIHHKEDCVLEKLAAHLPVKINKPDYTSVATKVNILLQSHFSLTYCRLVLKVAPNLLQAMVDVISSSWMAYPCSVCYGVNLGFIGNG
jgi:hypothetical protein